MNDLPRLDVGREQLADGVMVYYGQATVTLTERPMMPCPFDGVWSYRDSSYTLPCPKCGGLLAVHRDIPVPVGTRVEVGYWAPDIAGRLVDADVWHSIATATVAEMWGDAQVPEDGWIVTLTDIEAVS